MGRAQELAGAVKRAAQQLGLAKKQNAYALNRQEEFAAESKEQAAAAKGKSKKVLGKK